KPLAMVPSASDGELGCTSCLLQTTERSHFKTDFHRFNLNRKLKGLAPLSEDAFDELEELSSIEASSDDDSEAEQGSSREGSPFVHFLLPAAGGGDDKELLVYKQVLLAKSKDQADYLDLLKNLSLAPGVQKTWTLILISSGHFSAAVVDVATAKAIVHKTFHRYTTRRKQGGAQSSNDKSKGKANSAGAGIRRYNEKALQDDIKDVLTGWRDLIALSELLFIRTPATLKGHVFFDKQILDQADSRVRSFPFITKRPTLTELFRCFHELTEVKIRSCKPEQPAPAKQAKPVSSTAQLDEAIRKCIDSIKRGKLDLLKQFVLDGVDINCKLGDANGVSLLHVAASAPHADVVEWLLENGADPTARGTQSYAKPYDESVSKENRDVFRRFMASHPDRWNYDDTNIPGPLTSEMEQKAKLREVDRKKRQKERKKAEQLEDAASLSALSLEPQAPMPVSTLVSKSLKEQIGITPEMRQRMDREKRALAAEARARVQKNQCSQCGKSLSGIATFDKSIYRYCSMECLK
ncbi:hypothetical protein HDU91_001374, partial [Kappamyces sp. JEL0680]